MSGFIAKLFQATLSWLWGTIDQKIKENRAEEDRTGRQAAEQRLVSIAKAEEQERRMLEAAQKADQRSLAEKLGSL